MKDIAGSFRIEGFHQEYARISFIIDKVALKVYSSASFFRRVDMPEIERRVIEVIQEHSSPADVPGMRSVHPTDLLADLGIDSLDLVQLVEALQETFMQSGRRFQIPHKNAFGFESVADIIEYVKGVLELS